MVASLPLFRGITLPVLPCLPPVPRANAQGIAHPQTASAARPCLGLLGYHLSEVRASEPTLTVTRCGVEVARRLAIFAVKKLSRFEREETRAVRSTANEVSSASFRVLARNGQF